jgi:hypothetical protein
VPGAGVSAAMRSSSSFIIAASSMLRFPFFLRAPPAPFARGCGIGGFTC